MKTMVVKFFLTTVFFVIAGYSSFSQTSFVESQKSLARIADVFNRREDSLKKEFEAKKINWPPKALYIRSFKYDQLMEIWVKGDEKKPFRLFKTYAICMQSGITGPKRMEGDLQIPEGFYYVNEFNPNSNYHLSLGLNYPNASDQLLSDSLHPGGEIYIHGNCVSVGCLAITDLKIEELYIMATYAKASGQDFIPVHVFPVKYNEPNSMDYLARMTKDNQALQKFAIGLKEAFDYFEEKKKVPVILINRKGQYIIN